MNRLLTVGLGYSARAVARRLERGRWHIAGTARSEEGLRAIRASGYEAVPFSGKTPSPALSDALRETTHLLLSAPPTANGDPLLLHHGGDLVDALHLRWIGYLSTTGVYGDHGGGWVDETTPPRPIFDRSQWRVAAEAAWQDLAARRRLPAAVFRLAGIYGPGRNALEKLRAGQQQRIHKPGQVFTRIHVEDIAGAVEAAIRRDASGIFNISDDEPTPPQDVITFAAELLGMEPPPLIDWEEAQLSPMARSFYMENRRVRNAKMKDVLGVKLLYPTYREGLRALNETLQR